MSKPKFITAKEAAYLINDGDNIAVATFGCSGTPEEILMEVEKRYLETGHPKSIGYTHAAGGGGFAATKENGFCRCEDHLAHTGLMERWVCSHSACSDFTTEQLMNNKIAGWCLPLGTLLQVYKDQARGMKGTLSQCGLNTYVDPRVDGGAINQLAKDSKEQFVEYIPDFRGEEMLFFKGMDLNIGWMRGTKADKNGNISTDREPYNLEMLTIAQAVRANGGKVFVQVEEVVETGTIHPKMVKVPGIYVDYIVVETQPERRLSTTGGKYNPAFTGEARVDVSTGADVIPFDGVKVALRRTAMEVTLGAKANFGLGMPQMVGSILAEEGISGALTLISESGAVGGVPAAGINFGAHYNVESLSDQGDHFNFFDGGGLEFGAFGLGEVDQNGDLNTSLMGGVLKGVGGFMNICATSRLAVFIGTFTAGGIKTHIEDGKLVIDKEGKFKKFVKKIPQNSFSLKQAVHDGHKILYVTERCVFVGTAQGLLLSEIAPGIDLQAHILDQMEFKPIIPEGGPKLMPAELFQEKWGGLKAYLEAKGEI
ncbi:Acetate CoA-transferase YdiF [Pelotomaculum sp. FP]|uniref:CoA-transferase n=1 Tax=Pelotomaculum sp. FP TaxID=261474 RepID=UPI0010654948|nr:CoA-transferase [Pelotomaculum sp. FP]TEB14733.1 Acetate CoA-transferase YdiF [Pelotomaculum sp. FP]